MGFEVEVTQQDEEGGFTTKQYRIEPMTLITGTIRIHMDSQFERRAWLFNADESSEQTRRVRSWKVKNEQQTFEVEIGRRDMTDHDRSVKILKYVVKKLEPCTVMVPYIATLFSVLNENVLRARGDYDKVLNAVWLYGVLLQRVARRRAYIDTPKGRVLVVIPSPSQAIEVLEIILRPLMIMQSGLEERTQKLMHALREEGFTEPQSALTKYVREKLATRLGKSEPTIREYLREWVKLGFVSSNGKRPATYTLLIPLSKIENSLQGCVGIENLRNLEPQMIEEMNTRFRTFRSTASSKTPPPTPSATKNDSNGV